MATKVTISEETRSKVNHVSFSEKGSSYIPVSLSDFESISPTEPTLPLPISIWFVVEGTLYEFLTPKTFNQNTYGQVLRLALKNPTFKLYVRSQDNPALLRYVEECKALRFKGKSKDEIRALETISTIKDKVRQALSTVATNVQLTPEAFAFSKQIATEVFDSIVQQPKLTEILFKMMEIDSTYIAHTSAVAMISSALGNKLKLPEQHIKTLTLAAILHDIGLFKVPSKLVQNHHSLAGDELIIYHSHTAYGQEMLDDLLHAGTKISLEVEVVALQHHEKFNGTGYPNRKRGRQEEEGPTGIHPFARIVAVADSYHELVEKHKKEGGNISAAEILARLSKKDGSFDPVILAKMREIITLGV
jgi:HD-GYP domain-containing protein (c-di-GMP phosphodiesterase class II)